MMKAENHMKMRVLYNFFNEEIKSISNKMIVSSMHSKYMENPHIISKILWEWN